MIGNPNLPPIVRIEPASDGSDAIVITKVYPSGARLTTTIGPGYREDHFELPYHVGDIYDLLKGIYS